MSRGINRLSGADLRRSKPGLYGDGNNLFLQVSVSKTNHKQINRSWIFLVSMPLLYRLRKPPQLV